MEATLRSLAGDGGVREAAELALRGHFAGREVADVEAARVVAAFDRADAQPRRNRWIVGLGWFAFFISLPLLIGFAFKVYWGMALLPGASGADPRDGKLQRLVGGRLEAEQRLLLLGKEGERSEVARWRPLWERHPENPAYLAEVALAHAMAHQEVPVELLEAAGKVDPGNGWYRALGAAVAVDGAVRRERQSAEDKRAGKAPQWEVLDEPRLRDALLQLRAAAGSPRFTGHRDALQRERVALLPAAEDWISQVVRHLLTAGQPGAVIPLRSLAEGLAAAAQECVVRQDPEGFRTLVGDWQWLVRAVLADGSSLIDQMVARVMFRMPLANFRDAASAFGMADAAAAFGALEAELRDVQEARMNGGGRGDAQGELARKHGSIMAGLAMVTPDGLATPPEVAAEALKPGRLADHAMFSRQLLVLVWVLLVLVALKAMLWGRVVSARRALGRRMVDLLDRRDWWWILGGGVVLPVLWYGCVTRVGPLGSRGWSLAASGFAHPVYELLALWVLLAGGPLVVAAWRLSRHGGVFGLGAMRPWSGWVALAAGALVVPVMGIMMHAPGIPAWVFHSVACVFLGVALLGSGLPALMWTGREPAVRRAAAVRAALPGWFCGIVVCVAAFEIAGWEERHWVMRERLMVVPADVAAPTLHEVRVAAALREETRAMVERLAGVLSDRG